jgi:DnaK suppressor protein
MDEKNKDKVDGNYKELRDSLLKKRESLIKEIKLKARSESDDTVKTEVGDIYDLASNERDRELNLLISDRDREKLLQIEDAINRIDDGTYGICVECESPIPKERLVIMPFARLCVNCQAENERSKTMEKEFKEEREYRKLAFTSSDEEEA